MIPFRNPVTNSFLPEALGLQCFNGNSQILNGLWKATTQNTVYTIYFKSEMQPICVVTIRYKGFSFSKTWHFNFTVYWFWLMSDHARATVVNIFTLALLKRLTAMSTRVRWLQKCILVVHKVIYKLASLGVSSTSLVECYSNLLLTSLSPCSAQRTVDRPLWWVGWVPSPACLQIERYM